MFRVNDKRKTSFFLLSLLAVIMVILGLILYLVWVDYENDREELAFFRLFHDGNYQEFNNQYGMLDEVVRTSEKHLFYFGVSNYQVDDYDAVIDSLSLFSMLYPKSTEQLPVVDYLLGSSYYQQGSYEQALKHLLAAKAHGYASRNMDILLGFSYGYLHEYTESLTHLSEGGMGEQRIAYFLLDRYIESGLYADAALQIDTLLSLAHTDQEIFDLYTRKAVVLDWDDISLYRQLIDLLEDHELLHQSYLSLADALERSGSYIKARTMRNKASDYR